MVDYQKGILSGVVAAIVLLVLGFAFSMLFPAYSAWYMEVFAEMNMLYMWLSTILLGLFMGIIYTIVGPRVPGRGVRKGINYGIMVWLLAGVMWPVMAIGYAPMEITIYDLITGFIMYSAAGGALVQVYK